jgi:hypothetical protein
VTQKFSAKPDFRDDGEIVEEAVALALFKIDAPFRAHSYKPARSVALANQALQRLDLGAVVGAVVIAVVSSSANLSARRHAHRGGGQGKFERFEQRNDLVLDVFDHFLECFLHRRGEPFDARQQ